MTSIQLCGAQHILRRWAQKVCPPYRLNFIFTMNEQTLVVANNYFSKSVAGHRQQNQGCKKADTLS
ncbi:hypothetical protein [Desulfobacter vibrioformis]|uniref:hypothetical protein n=1 Tax=Desulfobacter vibrioformis TaxID=34031 RepID=UPI0012EC5CA9|nr:hypothetical protein [Desulfobacter vibrioformis]